MNASGIAEVLLNSLKSGYKAYVTCVSLCQDINGNNIFNESYDVSFQDQLYVPNIVFGQTGIIRFSVKVENGPEQFFDIEVYPPPS